ncbi:hypothetical protein O7626_37260 [Micromonospora sp. WMMD1102]|uniref:S24/S26 family peptidase n=1 Tax=Micromonospora sp. WMMD1102 TaxID=3016105 RepID=UPI0024153CFD|nr:hypothetical protein [Micromonospora sp. WMMD1102]MDG4791480.1 hypothetical protein [Micromonospora sp. WMMD1102]
MSGNGFADRVRATLAAGGLARVPVTGVGMLPVSPDGTVLVEPVDFEQVCPGEVVAYQHGERIVVHRVVSRLPEHLLTVGDDMPLYDPPVPRAALLGRVPQVAARPRRAPAVGGPPLPLPAGVTVWLVGAAARAVPEADHQLPAPGRHRPAALVRVRHLAAGSALPDRVRRALDALDALGGVTVGISPAAVRPVDDLRTGLPGYDRAVRPAHRLDIVLGCRFGPPGRPGTADRSTARPSTGTGAVLPVTAADRASPLTGDADGLPVTGNDDGLPVIAPDDVDHHLRPGPPLRETGPVAAIRSILAALGVPPLPGFPRPAPDGAP